jgi:hypothetical protein
MTKKDIREWHAGDGVGGFANDRKLKELLRRTLRPLIVGMLVSLVIVLWAARASGADGGDKTLSPFFSVGTSDANAEAFPLRSTDVAVNISGVIAKVTMRFTFSPHRRAALCMA